MNSNRVLTSKVSVNQNVTCVKFCLLYILDTHSANESDDSLPSIKLSMFYVMFKRHDVNVMFFAAKRKAESGISKSDEGRN